MNKLMGTAYVPIALIGGGVSSPYGRYGEPVFVQAFADSGFGKSVETLYTAAGHGFFMGPAGSFKPALDVVGFELHPQHQACITTLEQAIQGVYYVAQNAKALGVDIIVVDDCAELMKGSAAILKAAYGPRGAFDYWDHIARLLAAFRDTLRNCGLNAYTTWHHRRGEIDKETGTYWKGGPDVPSRKLVKLVPHLGDTVLRGDVASSFAMRPAYPWHGVYECHPGNDQTYEKDRHGFRGTLPMNVGELLRTAGYTLRRPVGLEWLEDAAEMVATAILSNKLPIPEMKTRFDQQLLKAGKHPYHIRWAWRDGYDRAVFKRHRSAAAILDY